ncbi:MAG: outer membrane beta-barrel protein [Bacteroidales bacterium]|nr:outer membrane beta-barrel protein [Bacteroidales bacterium]MBN2764519.1 outer membrane beta-barrel protein [Bacteroidales bacterium]
MKKIRIILIMLAFIGYAATISAQSSLTVKASPMYASLKFTDSQGTKLNSEYSGIFTGGYGLGYRLVTEGGFMVNVGAGIRKAGATMVYDEMNYTWDLQYAEGRLGVGYMLVSSDIGPYLDVAGYYGYLLRGFQTINNEDFNIKESESINNSDYGIVISPGVQIKLSYEIRTFIEFNYLMGLANLEKEESQKSKTVGYGLTFGFAFAF